MAGLGEPPGTQAFAWEASELFEIELFSLPLSHELEVLLVRELALLNFDTACATVNMLPMRHTALCTSSSVMESNGAPGSEKLGTGSVPFFVIHGC